ncbi:MAG: LptF/LptG family permease [Rikenellaceae bacterium]
MKTIHKLVLKTFLGPMIMTFFIVMFILMMNFVWRYIDELVGKGLEFSIIVELLSYAMINMVPLGLPLALLLAAIMTMGNLGENYELLAMKSAGMSLPKIIEPLIYLIVVISIASFFIINDLVPYANKKMFSTLYDIRKQKQVIEFKDGLFFNGIENMSIRVEKQEPDTKLLRDVLIYDNRDMRGNMTTTIADSGYIRLSDDKKLLMVTLFHGHTYEQTRGSMWYEQSNLRHNTFDKQLLTMPMDGFAMDNRTDANSVSNSQTKNITQLKQDIDSLDKIVSESTIKSYDPLLRQQLFSVDNSVVEQVDSLMIDKSEYADIKLLDSLPTLNARQSQRVWNSARQQAKNSRNLYSYDETSAKIGLTELYKSKVEWHKKLTTPISIIIFFLIGAPLGAIIRRGGLGMPVVVSVLFFVIYYVISLSGEKMAKEGNWDSFSGMWISAMILTPIAIFLTYKATNDSALFDFDSYINQTKRMGAYFKSKINKKKE